MCKITSAELFSTETFPFKTQERLCKQWNKWKDELCMYHINLSNANHLISAVYGNKGYAESKLSKLGLKITPPTMVLSNIVEDLCLQTPLGIVNFLAFLNLISPA